MSKSTLRLTQFQVEKMRRVGGAGRPSAYRITTYRGKRLGQFGSIAQYGWEAENAAHYESRVSRALNHAWRRIAGQA